MKCSLGFDNPRRTSALRPPMNGEAFALCAFIRMAGIVCGSVGGACINNFSLFLRLRCNFSLFSSFCDPYPMSYVLFDKNRKYRRHGTFVEFCGIFYKGKK